MRLAKSLRVTLIGGVTGDWRKLLTGAPKPVYDSSMDNLTAAQQRVFAKIKRLIAKMHYPPTRAEISKACGFASPNAAQEHMSALQKKGYIYVERNTARGIKILK